MNLIGKDAKHLRRTWYQRACIYLEHTHETLFLTPFIEVQYEYRYAIFIGWLKWRIGFGFDKANQTGF